METTQLTKWQMFVNTLDELPKNGQTYWIVKDGKVFEYIWTKETKVYYQKNKLKLLNPIFFNKDEAIKYNVIRNKIKTDEVEIYSIAIYPDDANVDNAMYIDLHINGESFEDIPFSLNEFKQSLIDMEELDDFINYLKK
jgi:hypothetical protein